MEKTFSLENFNPDGMLIDEVKEWEAFLRNTARAVKILFPSDPEKYENLLCAIDLWIYCLLKVRAMEYRLEGYIGYAVEFERDADLYYKRLPDGVRW